MKLYEFTRYNPLDDDVQQTLVFADNSDDAFSILYGYDYCRVQPNLKKEWTVKEIPVKKGIIELSF